jgi:hypothetical protein
MVPKRDVAATSGRGQPGRGLHGKDFLDARHVFAWEETPPPAGIRRIHNMVPQIV